jgi:mRNA-degrading endonuclease RelE of RelBE toxin-antitoxin system
VGVSRKFLETATRIPDPPGAANPGQKARIGFVKSAAEEFRTQPEKIQRGLMSKLKELAFHPESGKPLTGDLQGCCRVTYGRLRCVARVAEGVAVVLVLVVAERKAGSRDDAYRVAAEVVSTNSPGVTDLLARHVRAYLSQQPPGLNAKPGAPSKPSEVRARRKKPRHDD